METPKIVLIGAGDFGKNYLRVLYELHEKGSILLHAVCVRTEESVKALQSEYSNIEITNKLTDELLAVADGVILATPAETHLELIQKCRRFCPVLVEKPVVLNFQELNQLNELFEDKHEVMVGQIFRFHPVTTALKQLLHDMFQDYAVSGVSGNFVNPEGADKGREVLLELNHWIDMHYHIFSDEVVSVESIDVTDRLKEVALSSAKNGIARFTLGWSGDEKDRKFVIHFDSAGIDVVADYENNSLQVVNYVSSEQLDIPVETGEPLKIQLNLFIELIKGEVKNPVSIEEGAHSILVSEKIKVNKSSSTKRPRIAVIGAGIFGANIAYEVSKFADVIVYERGENYLQEGSKINQYRHHMGYHYPRSDETVIDIKTSTELFDRRFEKALLRDVPTYYGIAQEGSHVDGKTFKIFCDKHELPYQDVEYLDSRFINKDTVGTLIKVPEATYHHKTLVEEVANLINSRKNIAVKFSTFVENCSILSSGKKQIQYKNIETGLFAGADTFDYVINTTYANINTFAKWIGDRPHPVRVDLAEVLIVELPIEPVSLTVMDGPFATLMTTGNKNEFTLYHARESILDRYTPIDGLVKPAGKVISNSHLILNESKKLFPILQEAMLKESRIVNRGVLAYHEHDDARVADVVEHGFGCWSVLSGKIVSSVQTAQRLAALVQEDATT